VALTGSQKQKLYFGSASGYNEVQVRLTALPENYLHTANHDFYMPKEMQKGLNVAVIPGTNQPDPIAALYSNQSMDPMDTDWDPFNLTIGSFSWID